MFFIYKRISFANSFHSFYYLICSIISPSINMTSSKLLSPTGCSTWINYINNITLLSIKPCRITHFKTTVCWRTTTIIINYHRIFFCRIKICWIIQTTIYIRIVHTERKCFHLSYCKSFIFLFFRKIHFFN